jgi:hypothetical protein
MPPKATVPQMETGRIIECCSVPALVQRTTAHVYQLLCPFPKKILRTEGHHVEERGDKDELPHPAVDIIQLSAISPQVRTAYLESKWSHIFVAACRQQSHNGILGTQNKNYRHLRQRNPAGTLGIAGLHEENH